MQALDGQLWLVGTNSAGCAAEQVDATSLHTKLFPLPSCDVYVTAGDQHLYVLGIDESASNPTDQVHVASLDPATGAASVAPEVAGQTILRLGEAQPDDRGSDDR